MTAAKRTIKQEIADVFDKSDPEVNWGMTAEEAAERFLESVDTHLWSTTIDQFIDEGLLSIEGAAYKKLNTASRFSYDTISEEDLRKVIEKTEYAQRTPVYTDLSNETELTLSNGEVVTFNEHLKSKSA